MINHQICLLFGVLLVLEIQHNFVRMLQMISLEQYRRVIGLYASRTGPPGGLNKRHVHASFRFRLRLRLHLKLITASFCLFACAELLDYYYFVVVTLKPIPDLLIVLFLNVIAVLTYTEANNMF